MRNDSSRITMAQPIITLFDVRSTIPHDQPWAPNIWRIRFVLNYKHLPYSTHWVEFPNVERTLRANNAPPSSIRSDGSPIYTLPVIIDARTNTILSNANTIVEYLEVTYPTRPVFPEGSRALQNLFVHYIQEVFSKPLLPVMVPMSHSRLPERSRAHFIPSQREEPRQLSPHQREQAWAAVQEQFNFLASLLDTNRDGDGIMAMGHDISYADFTLCSLLIWIETISPHDGWARVRQWNGGRWVRLRNACRRYMDAC